MKNIYITGLGIILSTVICLEVSAGKKFYGKQLCSSPYFKCIKVKHGDNWYRMFPDKRNREIVMRLNRTNTALQFRGFIVVPKSFDDVTLRELSPLPLKIKARKRPMLWISLSEHAFGAYTAQGQLIHWGPISGGKGWCSDTGRACRTPTGNFSIYRKQGAKCKSSIFPLKTNGGAPMPWCMHFRGGYAIHGSNLPGYHASHGCVRVFPDDAKWLNKHFLKIGTRVLITP